MTPEHPSPTEIRSALQRVTLSEAFRNTPQLVSFLTFVVERSLAGEAQEIKGYTIATRALGRPPDFDPQTDPIVRVEAGRLRRALDLYYAGSGKGDPVRIRIPRGSYVPRFERAEEASAPPIDVPSKEPFREEAGIPEIGPAPVLVGTGIEAEPTQAGKAGWMARFLPARRGLAAAAAIGFLVVLTGLIAAGAGLIEVFVRQENVTSATPLGKETQSTLAVGPVERIGSSSISPEALRSALIDVLARFDEIEVIDLAAGSHPGSRRGYLLTATVGDGIGDATVRLTHQPTGEVVWTRTFHASGNTQFIQTELAGRIGTAVAQPYGVLEADLRRRSRVDERTRCLLMARDYWRSPSAEMHAQARDCLEAVVTDDPGAATVLAALSLIYLDEYRTERNLRPEPLDRALAAARRAIEAEPESAQTNYAMMAVLFARGDTAQALGIGRHLLELNPHDTNLLAELGSRYVRLGRYREGVQLIDRAAEANPAYPPWYDFFRFLAAYMEGDWPAAKAAAARIVEPDYILGLVAKIAVAQQEGRKDDVKALADRLVGLQPEYGKSTRSALGRWNFAEEIRERLIQMLDAAGLPA
ncbi:tetratricopeptide repeat protein [Microvirga massiliensis]|uniref:tetratricopeptide repeat protein n=1 Tax=Microvirga massiliensis TaxID=1033741 RepID=UPI00062B44CA|nr:tetratricopeptide repeat protein [Microvirga massiliensis]